MKSITASHLSDAALIEEIKHLSQSGREVTVALIVHLAELEARRLHLAAGFSSLFLYCTEVLRLSEAEAYNRIQAARVARRFPRVLDMLLDRSLNLTTVRLLAPELTEENHVALLNEAAHKSKWEVQKLLARHTPRSDTPPSVRKVAAPPAIVLPAADATAEVPAPALLRPAPLKVASPSSSRPVLTPLATDRYQVTFTARGSTCEKLRLAKDLLRHAVPSGDTAEIVDRALTALLEDLARKKCAATEQPRTSRETAKGSRHIPANVRRAVWVRDGGRCAFIAGSGHRCNERSFVEFHHLWPVARGGEATVANVALRCRAHNGYEAELSLGRLVMESALESARGERVVVPETRSGTSTAAAATSPLPATG